MFSFVAVANRSSANIHAKFRFAFSPLVSLLLLNISINIRKKFEFKKVQEYFCSKLI